ncbi:type I-E CRISPR-associated endonuclease Cas1e [Corynebacterium hylobatis]|nr:type I-E CRISPR-associated endonuclease Cas1e [Corynebacterium hylobatis]
MNTGMPPSKPQQLHRADNRVSFLYLEHCTLGRDGGALTATDEQGVVHVPVAALSVLFLGPGTRLTHQAVSVVADSGCSLVWVGEEGVRYYAHGRSIARSDKLLVKQAEKVSNRKSRMSVARAMYAMRFPGEDTAGLNMQQLRGKEGARVRRIYRESSEKYKVDWHRRIYDPNDFFASDPINQALSAAHTCLYGLCHSVIAALGCSPGLGFIHTGHDRAFVYDIADLYKAETSIPLAFQVVADLNKTGRAEISDVASITRRAMRDEFRQLRLVERVAEDLKTLLIDDDASPTEDFWADIIQLWDGGDRQVAGGTNYEQSDEQGEFTSE